MNTNPLALVAKALKDALRAHQGNRTMLARSLGVSRQRVQHWIKRGVPRNWYTEVLAVARKTRRK